MLILLSVGISNYLSNDIDNLPKTVTDTNDIYKLLSQLSENNFSHERSISQIDITSIQFITLLDSICESLNKEDIFILYFSGHGSLDNNELFFYFEDANPKKDNLRGKISFSNIKQILCSVTNSVICIFDCCHSGASIKSSLSPDTFKKSNLSILASSPAYQATVSSKDDNNNSPFTSYLINYIKYSYNSSGKVTISDLTKSFDDSDYTDALIHVQEGAGDITLLESTTYDIERTELNFPKQFFSKIKTSNIRTREMLWYSLKDIPNHLLINIFTLWFDDNFFEPSWLVRRAVGSILSNKIKINHEIIFIIEKFLESRHWSDHCIGIIGSRFLLKKDSNLQGKVKNLFLNENRMDVVWLAHLYLTDSDLITIEDSISTKLSSSLWGLTDIWDRYRYKKNTPIYTIVKKLVTCSEQNHTFDDFILHIKLTYPHYDFEKDDNEFISFLKHIYQKPKRNNITDQNIKWLLSVIYGEWRGQLDLSLENYFSSLTTSQMDNILNKTFQIPSVECRMAIFQYLSRTPNKSDYLNNMQWINTECHPWVKREAIDTLSKYNKQSIVNSDIKLVDNNIYPGNTDLMLSYITCGLINDDKLQEISESLTEAEKESLLKFKKITN